MIHNKFRYILTLVALFAMTAGAWAEETVFEYADPMVGTLTQGTGTSATTVTINSESVNAIKFGNTYKYADGKYITIAPSSGSFKKGDVVSIAGCISNSNSEAYAKAGIYTADGATQLYETANVVNAQLSTDAPVVETYTLTQDAEKLLIARSTGTTALYITTLKVLRTASDPAGTVLTPDATRKIWTLAAMPAGDVELQVEYYPGMLVKPTNLVGGTMEIEGVTDTTLPEGFEKDDDGNIYVEAGKTFKVKAVPAEGYQLTGWSDDAENKQLEREFTMPADGSDFTITATFSDEFELTFAAANALTIEAGMATVSVGDADATLTDGKLSVKSGQTVTLNAAQGYKFRKVEVKKGGPQLQTVHIGGLVDATFYYLPGETWKQAIDNHPTENAGFSISSDIVLYNGKIVYIGYYEDYPYYNTVVDPTKDYQAL